MKRQSLYLSSQPLLAADSVSPALVYWTLDCCDTAQLSARCISEGWHAKDKNYGLSLTLFICTDLEVMFPIMALKWLLRLIGSQEWLLRLSLTESAHLLGTPMSRPGLPDTRGKQVGPCLMLKAVHAASSASAAQRPPNMLPLQLVSSPCAHARALKVQLLSPGD